MNDQSKLVVVTGAFDDIRSADLRFLEEASKMGKVHVLLWPDKTVRASTGRPPKFPFAEREYFLKAVRFVAHVELVRAAFQEDRLPAGMCPDIWVDRECPQNSGRATWSRKSGIEYRVLSANQLAGFPTSPAEPKTGMRKKVMVTGCYDFFHSGHIRFFEEISAYGELYVVVGHDANIRLLKGEGHPLLSQEERRYVAGTIRYVTEALISSGDGWLDAEPEIQRIKPNIYAVNEDGDRGGKRQYCEQHGIEYLVLKRRPAPGLPPRTSTELRGF
ncbi:MAG TPA: adenylyltransferase/cytidyltransferase family protein [Candidatus Limnocylindrales bacterium]|nr:adenylyltransferase/cytidyltransferase family protein [Candidatus Limnocylindrales bacterium]